MDLYILKDKIPVRVHNVIEWSQARELVDRQIVNDFIGGFLISTIFLGMDHRFGFDSGAPILFETMIFDHRKEENFSDIYAERYSSYEQAEEGHKKATTWLKEYIAKE